MGSRIDKSLIKKYLDGQCSPSELLQVKAYLQRPDAQNIFNEIWEEEWADKIKPEQADTVQMGHWRKMMEKRIYDAAINEPIVVPFFKQPKLWRYVAIWLVVILGAGIWTIGKHHKNEPTVIAFIEKTNPKGQRTMLTLPDSSVVYLGADSKLRFAEHFNGNSRQVELEGEAFFEVTKNPKKPFIITTGTIQTRVVGTSFKVDAFNHQPLTVQVRTGKVRVDRKVGNKLQSIAVLTPGQKVTWNEQQQTKLLADFQIEDLNDWKNGKLVFRETQLAEITAILERWYNVKIDIKNKSTSRRLMKVNLTTNIPVNRVMKILSASGHFTYQIDANHITIN